MKSFILTVVSIAAVAAGCGSQPQHEVKPLAARPSVTTDYSKLRTPEEKINFIQNSKAPESEKKKAIEQVKAGQL